MASFEEYFEFFSESCTIQNEPLKGTLCMRQISLHQFDFLEGYYEWILTAFYVLELPNLGQE